MIFLDAICLVIEEGLKPVEEEKLIEQFKFNFIKCFSIPFKHSSIIAQFIFTKQILK